jgi:hypothetical protein
MLGVEVKILLGVELVFSVYTTINLVSLHKARYPLKLESRILQARVLNLSP